MYRAATHISGKMQWRAFYTCPRAEKKCEHRLRENDIHVFLPVQTVVRQWKDRKKKIREPLFNNYIFARVHERDRSRVLQTRGIVRCVAFGGVPATITQEEIDQIRLLQKHPWGVEQMAAPPRVVGTTVRIEEGSLKGLTGEVIELRGESRLIVRITSLNMAIRVEVPFAMTKSA